MYSLDDSTRTGFGGFMEDAEVAEQKGSTGYYTSSDDDDSTISSDGNDKFMTYVVIFVFSAALMKPFVYTLSHLLSRSFLFIVRTLL